MTLLLVDDPHCVSTAFRYPKSLERVRGILFDWRWFRGQDLTVDRATMVWSGW
jgi:hypothetical protein